MITQMLLCASALLLGETQTAEPRPQPQVEQAVEPGTPAQQTPDAAPAATPENDAAKNEVPEDKVIDGVKLAAIEANLISATNEQRVRHGLPALEVDKELMETSREQAEWMTRNRTLTHTRRPLAENIAMGQPHSSDAVRAWMNSSGHRANILNPGHRRIGVAAFRTAGGVIYWCQQFRR